MSWHYAHGEQRVGPLDESAIKALIASKVITSRTLVWREGMTQWSAAAQSELAGLLPKEPTANATPPPLPTERVTESNKSALHCRHCSKPVAQQAVVCTSCGCAPMTGTAHCHNCGAATNASAEICMKCGVRLRTAEAGAKSKLTAGLFGIFLGAFGVHRFYLGYIAIGCVQVLVTILTLGWGGLWGFLEGILILTGTIDKDAEGKSLTD